MIVGGRNPVCALSVVCMHLCVNFVSPSMNLWACVCVADEVRSDPGKVQGDVHIPKVDMFTEIWLRGRL